MRRWIYAVCLLACLSVVPARDAFAATCVGAEPCHACKNCKYCKHCAKKGGHCGVCKPSKPSR